MNRKPVVLHHGPSKRGAIDRRFFSISRFFLCFAVILIAVSTVSPVALAKPVDQPRLAVATGPLRVLASNPRYFTDGSGRAILLTGSHTWSNFQDKGGGYPPPVF